MYGSATRTSTLSTAFFLKRQATLGAWRFATLWVYKAVPRPRGVPRRLTYFEIGAEPVRIKTP